MTATVRTLLDAAPSDQDEPAGSVLPAPAGWPAPPGPAAYHGLLGEIVRRLEPETEADPVAILAQLLVCFGAAVGLSQELCRERRDETGPEKGMRESDIEDLANRHGPEPCVVVCEGAAKRR